jgi:hypothetical protein
MFAVPRDKVVQITRFKRDPPESQLLLDTQKTISIYGHNLLLVRFGLLAHDLAIWCTVGYGYGLFVEAGRRRGAEVGVNCCAVWRRTE